ncbi:MAG TPA: DUF4235 domain-containing protein [Nocardioidaceae bacterium]|nr:DUF4235 domain-containing protein [Nocardioidaceae bacterium]
MSKAAKLAYRPVSLAGSVVGGLVAGAAFKQVWRRAPMLPDDAPQPLQSETRFRDVLVAAAIQGAIFGVVKAVIDRGSARAFQRWTGEWPGD